MQTAVQAYIRANKCNLSEQERFAYCLMYISSLTMANYAGRTMRRFTTGRDKMILGQEIKNRENRLKDLGARVSNKGNSKEWQESEERLEMRASLIADFALMVNQFDDDDDMIDFFSDRIKLVKLDAIQYSNRKNG